MYRSFLMYIYTCIIVFLTYFAWAADNTWLAGGCRLLSSHCVQGCVYWCVWSNSIDRPHVKICFHVYTRIYISLLTYLAACYWYHVMHSRLLFFLHTMCVKGQMHSSWLRKDVRGTTVLKCVGVCVWHEIATVGFGFRSVSIYIHIYIYMYIYVYMSMSLLTYLAWATDNLWLTRGCCSLSTHCAQVCVCVCVCVSRNNINRPRV